MTVRGMPQPPKISKDPTPPTLRDDAKGWRGRWQQRQDNRAGRQRYENEVIQREQRASIYEIDTRLFKEFAAMCAQYLPKDADPLLVFAKRQRETRTLSAPYRSRRYIDLRLYDNPTTYITDLYANGFPEEIQARTLLKELEAHGGVPGPQTREFLEKQVALRHIAPQEHMDMTHYMPPAQICAQQEQTTLLARHQDPLAALAAMDAAETLAIIEGDSNAWERHVMREQGPVTGRGKL